MKDRSKTSRRYTLRSNSLLLTSGNRKETLRQHLHFLAQFSVDTTISTLPYTFGQKVGTR